MRNPNEKRPAVGRSWFRSVVGLGMMSLATFGAGWVIGQMGGSGTQAIAQTPRPAAPAQAPPAASEYSSDYRNRVVAQIYGNIDITREELGEYLIARYGAEKLELLVNAKIIEHACREKGLEVTAAEVDAELAKDCKGLGVTPSVFVKQVLKQYHKTLYEWKEDVLRPRTLMVKYCQDRAHVEEEDMKKAFESHYGEKVQVRILLYPKDMQKAISKIYEKIRESDAEFVAAAKAQPNSTLAMNAGKCDPIHRYSSNDDVERIAFSLKDGELSEVIETTQGILIMKCDKHLPPDRTKIYENEIPRLKAEVLDKKIQLEVGKVFKEMSEKAQPKKFLASGDESEVEMFRRTEDLLKETSPAAGAPRGH